jgi:hypothetical protein
LEIIQVAGFTLTVVAFPVGFVAGPARAWAVNRRRIIHRSDVNQADIVKTLRKCGATVDIIGEPLDLLVGWRGMNYLMEVKPDAKSKLRPSQVEFFATWRGQKARVNSVSEALAVLGIRDSLG